MISFEKVRKVVETNREDILDSVKDIYIQSHLKGKTFQGFGYNVVIDEEEYEVLGPYCLATTSVVSVRNGKAMILLNVGGNRDCDKEITLQDIDQRCSDEEYARLLKEALEKFELKSIDDIGENNYSEFDIVNEMLNLSSDDLEENIIRDYVEDEWTYWVESKYSEEIDSRLQEFKEEMEYAQEVGDFS